MTTKHHSLHHDSIYATASLVKEKGKIAQKMVGVSA